MGLEHAQELSQKCVHCGFCLEACPTYGVTRSEVHSPRGRIVAIASGVLNSSGIQTCVFCRRCEEACPSGVEFGEIMSNARTPSLEQLIVHRLLEHPLRLYYAARLAKQGLPLQLARRVAQITPEPAEPPEHSDPEAEINLFAGCIAPVFFKTTVMRALAFLHQKYRVGLINACCGLAHHSEGERERALSLIQNLVQASQGRPIVSLPSNCSAHIKSHALGVEAYDFAEFVELTGLQLPTRRGLSLTVHEPCHARLADLNKYVRSALKRMGVQLVEMSDPTLECGAGGGYIFEQPEISGRIMDVKKREIEATSCRNVVSTNFACSLAFIRMGFTPLHLADLV
ncbi:MAG: (Fe-S)-binding protein [Thermoprotei archaeon]